MTRRAPSEARPRSATAAARPTPERHLFEPLERRALLSAVIGVIGGATALDIRAGQTVQVNGLGSDVSADGDADPATGPGTVLTARFQWNFGDPAVPTAATPVGVVPIVGVPVVPVSGGANPFVPTGADPTGNEGVGPVSAEGSTASTPALTPVVAPASVSVRQVPVLGGLTRAVPVPVLRGAFRTAPQAVAGGQFNTLEGFNAAHVYERPGDYSLSLTVTDAAGVVSTATVPVHVSPDDRRAVYVAATGAADADGATQASAVNFDGLRRILTTGAPENDARILFRRGDLFSFTAPLRFDGLHDLTLGAYGVGGKPILRYGGAPVSITPLIGMNDATRNLTVRDLSLESIFTGFEKAGVPDGIQPRGTNISIIDNEFHNLSYAVNTNLRPDGVLVQGNRAPAVSDLRAYFVWLGGSDIVITGNTVANSTREHVVRGAGWERVLVAHNNLTNTIADPVDIIKGAVVLQAGNYGYVADNRIQGPIVVGPLGDGNGTPPERTNFVVVERNRVTGEKIEVIHGAQDVVIRNNVVVMKQDGQYEGIKVDGYTTTQSGVTYNRGTQRVAVLFNTVVMGKNPNRGIWIVPGGVGNSLVGNLVTTEYGVPYESNRKALDTGADPATKGPVVPLYTYVADNIWYAGKDGKASTAIKYDGSYITPAAWNAMLAAGGFPGNDLFLNVPLDGQFAPNSAYTAAARPFGGVFTDLTGKLRPADGQLWTVGAVETFAGAFPPPVAPPIAALAVAPTLTRTAVPVSRRSLASISI